MDPHMTRARFAVTQDGASVQLPLAPAWSPNRYAIRLRRLARRTSSITCPHGLGLNCLRCYDQPYGPPHLARLQGKEPRA